MTPGQTLTNSSKAPVNPGITPATPGKTPVNPSKTPWTPAKSLRTLDKFPGLRVKLRGSLFELGCATASVVDFSGIYGFYIFEAIYLTKHSDTIGD